VVFGHAILTRQWSDCLTGVNITELNASLWTPIMRVVPPMLQAAKGEASTVTNSLVHPSINPSRSQAAGSSFSPSPFYVPEPHQSSVPRSVGDKNWTPRKPAMPVSWSAGGTPDIETAVSDRVMIGVSRRGQHSSLPGLNIARRPADDASGKPWRVRCRLYAFPLWCALHHQ
jgi:hypothetical protein